MNESASLTVQAKHLQPTFRNTDVAFGSKAPFWQPVSHFRGRDASYLAPTGSPEAVARLRLPQNVACGFTALRSSAVDLQHCKSLQLRVTEAQLWSQ